MLRAWLCKLSGIYNSSPQGYIQVTSHMNSCETRCRETANHIFSAAPPVWRQPCLLIIKIVFSCLILLSTREIMLMDLTSTSPSTRALPCLSPSHNPLKILTFRRHWPIQRPCLRSVLRCLWESMLLGLGFIHPQNHKNQTFGTPSDKICTF